MRQVEDFAVWRAALKAEIVATAATPPNSSASEAGPKRCSRKDGRSAAARVGRHMRI